MAILDTTGEIIIHEGNYQQFINPTIDGEVKKCGTIPRNMQTHPEGYYRWAIKPNFPITPQDQWENIIADKEAAKATLRDIVMNGMPDGSPIPARDQNGRGYCHTADTEVLTEHGWVAWSDYNYRDMLATVDILGTMEFQAPFEKHVYEYDGEIVHSTNRRLDFGVTPDHRMLVRKWDERLRTLSSAYTFQRAGEIGWYAGFMHAPRNYIGTELKRIAIPGDREYDGDDFLALLSLVISDGYAGNSEKSMNLVSFVSFCEDSRERVAVLANRLGFKEQPGRCGVWNRWGAGALAAWIRTHCYADGGFKAQQKKVPDLVKVVSKRQLEHFLVWNGDQNHDRLSNGERYYSTSKRLVDDLQELLLRVGKRGKIRQRDERPGFVDGKEFVAKACWELNVANGEQLCIDRKKHIETDRYKGLVYCAAVPNGTLITRRNGSVLISGNCWQHSGVTAMMIWRAIMNLPYVDLSAYGPACRDKNFADEGGWGAAGVDNLIKWGCPTSKTWPQQGTSRSYDNEATWAEAAHYKVTEQWADMSVAQYDRNMAFAQFVTLNLSGRPTDDDYNWWGHSVCGMDAVSGKANRKRTRSMQSGKLLQLAEFDKVWAMNDPVTAGIGRRIGNSWGSTWSDNGMGILTGDKAKPDGGVGIVSVSLYQ